MEELLKIGLVWIVISVPASLVIGRMLAASGRAEEEGASSPVVTSAPVVRPRMFLHRIADFLGVTHGELAIRKE
jgi:hypothetical protein